MAPNKGPATCLADIEIAAQTKIPILKQHLSDALWAVCGEGAQAERFNRMNSPRRPLSLLPSRASTIAQGFGSVARFFPGCRELLAAIDDEIAVELMGPVIPGKAHCFKDRYISTGGQLYQLMMGHDRWVADLRPLIRNVTKDLGLCCHPYDLCTELIARETGVIVTDHAGSQLKVPLDVETDCAWVGYCDPGIAQAVGTALRAALSTAGHAVVLTRHAREIGLVCRPTINFTFQNAVSPLNMTDEDGAQ